MYAIRSYYDLIKKFRGEKMDCKEVVLKTGGAYKNVQAYTDKNFSSFIVICKEDRTREFVNVDNISKIIPNDEPSYMPIPDVITF